MDSELSVVLLHPSVEFEGRFVWWLCRNVGEVPLGGSVGLVPQNWLLTTAVTLWMFDVTGFGRGGFNNSFCYGYSSSYYYNNNYCYYN